MTGTPLNFSPASPFKLTETAEQIEQLAILVSGDEAEGRRWFLTPSSLLGGQTPRQAVATGRAEFVSGMLYGVAGL